MFRALSEVREHTEQWLADYNQEIPHDSLGLTPAEFRLKNEPRSLIYFGTELQGVDNFLDYLSDALLITLAILPYITLVMLF